MKNHFILAKWLLNQTRAFIYKFILIIICGITLAFCGVIIAIASKNLIDAATQGQRSGATAAAILLMLVILAQVVIQAVVSIQSDKLSILFSNYMRKKLLDKLYHSNWQQITKYHSGDILTRVSSDIDVVTTGIASTLPNVMSLTIRIVAAFSVLFYLEPTLALLAFVLGPASILFSRLFGRKLKELHIKMQETESNSRALIHESIQNIQVIKAFRLEAYSLQCVDKLLDRKKEWTLLRSRVEAAAGAILSSGYWIGFFLAFAWGAFNLSKGSTGFGTLAAFIQLIEQIQSPFIGLAHTLPQLVSVAGSAERLMELENLEQEISGIGVEPLCCAGVEFEHVSFSYKSEQRVLENISFRVKPGETIAIIGASGEGKTTLLRLVLSFITPQDGHIYFTDSQGKRYNACAGTRSLVSYIPQGNTLFSGSIEENLKLGSQNTTPGDLETAIRAANAWDFIEKLPQRFSTIIGERGIGLSAGQAQRLAIARAFLHKAPILVLDEATSELDADTEINIIQALQNLNPKRTCIIITHRPAALAICDRILKLENGKILECRPSYSSPSH